MESQKKDPDPKITQLEEMDSVLSLSPEYPKYRNTVIIGSIVCILISLVSGVYFLTKNIGLPLDRVKNVIEIEVRKLKRKKPAKIFPLQNSLSISSDPSGAKITLDGKYIGNSPKDFGVNKGWHTIKLEKEGYQTFDGQIKIYDGNEDYSAVLRKKDSADTSSTNRLDRIVGSWHQEGELMTIEKKDNKFSITMNRIGSYYKASSKLSKSRQDTYGHNISWDGKNLTFLLWVPTSGSGYNVFYSLTLMDDGALSGTKQADGSSYKVDCLFEKSQVNH